MTKTELYTNVANLMNEYAEQFKSKKQFESFKAQMDELLKPKAGGGVIQFAPITKDGVTYHRCRYTELYLPESEMVMSNGKSKGYSKRAIAVWTKMGREAQALNDEAMKLLLAGDAVTGTLKAQEAEQLKLDRNKPSSYEDLANELAEIALEA